MTDALLVSDQDLDKRFLAIRPGRNRPFDFAPQTLERDPFAQGSQDAPQHFEGYHQILLQDGGLGRIFGARSPDEKVMQLDAYYRRTKAALGARSARRSETERNFEEEMQWLAENRQRFRGQWIALQGRELLATGASAREVFLKVAKQKEPPLVVRVDSEELPFAGW